MLGYRWVNKYILKDNVVEMVISDSLHKIGDVRIMLDSNILIKLQNHQWTCKVINSSNVRVSTKSLGKSETLQNFIMEEMGLSALKKNRFCPIYVECLNDLRGFVFRDYVSKGEYPNLVPVMIKMGGKEYVAVRYYDNSVKKRKSFVINDKRNFEEALSMAKEFIALWKISHII